MNDMSHLLDPVMFAEFAQTRRRSHRTDHEVYDDLLAAVRAKYRSEHVEGDGRFDARRRSRRLERQAKKLVRAARAQYEAMESLQVAHADHLAHVAALPDQRRARALARAQRSTVVGELAAKSLHKTAGALTSKNSVEDGGQDSGSDVPESLTDLRKRRRGAA
ncbi:hypothetical protein [Streptomyces uncialis]|uniref:hypothetical protein n=1 Tax=Streptomyces uncialis TaxID=1048205 RepID=UPI0038646784|nr:hypothetical protein OG924_37540 [Streptomyces uncialis]